jgi:hypothetical protein
LWPKTLKQLQEGVGNTLEETGIGNDFLKQNSEGSSSKRNNEQMGLHQTKELHSKRNNHQTQETAHSVGEKSLLAIHPIRI